MRYDEAGEFFIREMEMKRLYKQDTLPDGRSMIRRNNRIIRNLSLTGLYYHLSKYGQSFSRPTIFGIGIVIFSTLLWLTQPSLSFGTELNVGLLDVAFKIVGGAVTFDLIIIAH